MARRKLIFFTISDPATDPGGLFRAYHFAGVAASSGLEAEVRLAGEAVTAADPAALPDTDLGRDMRAKVAGGAEAAFEVSF